MAVTVTRNTIAAPVTSTNALSGLRTAMQNAGFGTNTDNYVASGETRDIYEINFGTSTTYSIAYIETRLNNTSLNLSTACYWSWNSTTKVGSANPTVSATNFTFSSALGVNFVAFDGGAEWKMVVIIQGLTIGAISLIRPSLARPSWWTDSNFPYFFMGKNITGSSQFIAWESTGGTSLSPFANVSYVLRSINLQGVVNANQQRQVVRGVQLQSGSGTNQGFVGQFSGDIAQAAANGLGVLDVINVLPGVEEFTVLQNASGGLVLRTV